MQRRVKSPGEGPNGTMWQLKSASLLTGLAAVLWLASAGEPITLVYGSWSTGLLLPVSEDILAVFVPSGPKDVQADTGKSCEEEKGEAEEGGREEREKGRDALRKDTWRKTNPCFFTSKETIGNTIIMANFFLSVYLVSQVLSKHFACINPLNLYISPLSFLPLSPHFIDRETEVQSPCMLFTVLRYLTFPVSVRAVIATACIL